jgi:hypothetical protein
MSPRDRASHFADRHGGHWRLPGRRSFTGIREPVKANGRGPRGLRIWSIAAAGPDDPWLKSKAALARVFAGQVLTQAPGLADGLMDGAEDLAATSAEALGG